MAGESLLVNLASGLAQYDQEYYYLILFDVSHYIDEPNNATAGLALCPTSILVEVFRGGTRHDTAVIMCDNDNLP